MADVFVLDQTGIYGGQELTEGFTDRIRLQQEDPPHDAQRSQGFCCQQR